MKLNRFFLALLAAAAMLTATPHQSVQAAQAVMCQGDVSGASTGARTIGGSTSQVPSGTVYTLNPSGCATIQQADIGYFQSQGYTPGSPFGQPIIFTTGVQTGTTDLVVGTLPAGAYIVSISANNTTANAVTGGIDFASTANGTDIVSAMTCAANCVSNSPGTTTLTKSVFAATGGTATTLHAAAHAAGSWNSSNVTITVLYAWF